MRTRQLFIPIMLAGLFIPATVFAAEDVTEKTVSLQNVDACYAVQSLLGRTDVVPRKEAFLQYFAENMFRDQCERTGYEEGMRRESACAAMYPKSPEPGSYEVPEDVTVRPLVLGCSNRAKIRGPEKQVEIVEGFLSEIDSSQPGMMLEVRWVDWSEEDLRELELQWTDVEPCAGQVTGDPAPPLRFAIDPLGASVGKMDRSPNKWFNKCAKFSLKNDVQSVLAMGEIVRFCCPLLRYDSWARIPIQYRDPSCLFFGVEMWVRPVVAEDGRILLRLRPRTGEAIGHLRAIRQGLRRERCAMETVVKHQAQAFEVTVEQGSALVIDGLRREDLPVRAAVQGPERPLYISDQLSRHPTMILTVTRP